MFEVVTDFPIASDSIDHLRPGGTMHDSSDWPIFNQKLYAYFPTPRPLFVADLGCAGGGFVKRCVDDGHQAIGLEGSDYSLLRKRAEWATIPNNLFTCDITKPFQVYYNRTPVKFNVITAWEVMEHLSEEGIRGLCANVKNHLDAAGVWIMSVSKQPGEHHVTVQQNYWWMRMFVEQGFENHPHIVQHFGDDMLRGPTERGKAPDSFHLALTISGEANK